MSKKNQWAEKGEMINMDIKYSVKDINKILKRSIDELDDLDKGKQIKAEAIAAKVTVTGRNAIFFRDILEISKLNGTAPQMMQLLIEAGIKKMHEGMRDVLLEKAKENVKDESRDILVKKLKERGVKQEIIDFLASKMKED
jgi:hypothetical protein